MKAIVFKKHGGSEVLELTDVEEPKVGHGEVKVDIKAAGINHLDIWVRMGMPGVTLPLPHIPGSDASGVVEEVGEGVVGLKVGDPVIISPGMGDGVSKHCAGGWDSLCDSYHLLGLQIDGTYCEKLVVPARRAIKVSTTYSFEEWACVSLVFLTAWHMLHTNRNNKRGIYAGHAPYLNLKTLQSKPVVANDKKYIKTIFTFLSSSENIFTSIVKLYKLISNREFFKILDLVTCYTLGDSQLISDNRFLII